MSEPTVPHVGAIVRVMSVGDTELFALLAGPFSPDAPGASWFGAPLIERRAFVADDEMLVYGAPKHVAAAWASTSIPAWSIAHVVATLTEDEQIQLYGLVLDVDGGRIAAPVGRTARMRTAVIRRWFYMTFLLPLFSKSMTASQQSECPMTSHDVLGGAPDPTNACLDTEKPMTEREALEAEKVRCRNAVDLFYMEQDRLSAEFDRVEAATSDILYAARNRAEDALKEYDCRPPVRTPLETLEAEKALLGDRYARFEAERDRVTAEMSRISSEQTRVIDAISAYQSTHPDEVFRD